MAAAECTEMYISGGGGGVHMHMHMHMFAAAAGINRSECCSTSHFMFCN